MEPSIIQQHGYVWLSYPREGIMPFNLLLTEKNKFFKRVWKNLFDQSQNAEAINADIFALFPKSKRGYYPTVNEEPKDAPFFEGHDILSFEAGLGMETIDKLSLIGSANAKIDLSVANKLLFSFKNVLLFTVENEILLEEHLNKSKPNCKAPGFLKNLNEGNVYVVTEVLQTNEFTIRNANEFQFKGNVDTTAIKNFIDANVKFNSQNDSDNKMEFKSEKRITFALKAYRILYNNETGNYILSKKPLKLVRADATTIDEPEYLSTDDGLIFID